jgi:RNA 2',3'-cyclic 3'-phosphodiesterase
VIAASLQREVGVMRSVPTFGNPISRHNIFFALYPPRDVARRIARLTDRMFEEGELRGPRVAPERLHVTLKSLGSYSALHPLLIARAGEIASKVKMPAFSLALNRVMSFENRTGLRPRVLVGDEGVFGVFRLHGALHEAEREVSRSRRREPRIEPHLTLSREDSVRPEDLIDPIVWRVREFRLIDSAHGESRHNVLGRWPLL